MTVNDPVLVNLLLNSCIKLKDKKNSFNIQMFDLSVLYEGKERLMAGCDIIVYTETGKSANVNNSGGNRTFITYRRANQKMAHSSLAVTEICVIIASKVNLLRLLQTFVGLLLPKLFSQSV